MGTFETRPVSEFAAPESDIQEIFHYPGLRPEGSFMTDGEVVTELPTAYKEFVEAADRYLAEHSLPLIAERYPVLAYGANANPVRLRNKMKKFGVDHQDTMQVVPNIMATLPNTAAVWHGRTGQKGGVFADLYSGQEVEGVNLHAHVAFLTKEQFAAIHDSEGATYSVAEVPAYLGDAEDSLPAQVSAYVSINSQLSLIGGKPVLVGTLNHDNTNLPKKHPRGMITRMLKRAQVDATPEEHIERMIDLPLEDKLNPEAVTKKSVQAAIGSQLIDQGISRKFIFANLNSGAYIGRTDFTSMPGGHDKHLLQIPEMALALIRPKQEGLDERLDNLRKKYPKKTEDERRALIDPARKISRQALDEIAVRLGDKAGEMFVERNHPSVVHKQGVPVSK